MPYRPSANPKCTGEGLGGWYRMGNCYHGKLFKINFMLKGVALPSKLIVSVAYNTNEYGVEPQRSKTPGRGPSDSLNVALTGTPTVGSDSLPNDAYFNTSYGPFYCDGGVGWHGPFRLGGGCWTGYQPQFELATR